MSKDVLSVFNRRKWFLTAAQKFSKHYRVTDARPEKNTVGSRAEFDYDFDNLDYSYHLRDPKTKQAYNLYPLFADLLDKEYNDILKEDWRNLEKNISEYFDFHNVSKDQIKKVINRNGSKGEV